MPISASPTTSRHQGQNMPPPPTIIRAPFTEREAQDSEVVFPSLHKAPEWRQFGIFPPTSRAVLSHCIAPQPTRITSTFAQASSCFRPHTTKKAAHEDRFNSVRPCSRCRKRHYATVFISDWSWTLLGRTIWEETRRRLHSSYRVCVARVLDGSHILVLFFPALP
ncbi:hypothetical protein LZ32DRAFT_314601 [Colletotrichum eremochloae]|nr:hypothetical protein LZ32DRAFT_314601 [Colletotrichum eremochloae]